MPEEESDVDLHNAPHVSLRDIAAEIGCSHSSVARAIRGQKRVGEELRQRILAKAKEMGYRPNPMVASLMAIHNSKRERKHLAANISWINENPNEDFWHKYAYTKVFFEAAKKRAHENGFGFDEIWAGEPGMTGRRLNDILHTRGIMGLVFSTSALGLTKTGFSPSEFAAVSLRDELPGQPLWHRAGTSGRKNTELAFQKLRHLGYKRIAILLGLSTAGINLPHQELCQQIQEFNSAPFMDHRRLPLGFNKQLLAGFYYMQQSIDPSERLRPFGYDHTAPDSAETLAEYLTNARPDAILCHNNDAIEGAKHAKLEVPEDIAIAHLNLGDDVEGWAGIETHPEQQAAAAIDLLSAQILRNERGTPKFPQFIHVEGEWRDGWTVAKG